MASEKIIRTRAKMQRYADKLEGADESMTKVYAGMIRVYEKKMALLQVEVDKELAEKAAAEAEGIKICTKEGCARVTRNETGICRQCSLIPCSHNGCRRRCVQGVCTRHNPKTMERMREYSKKRYHDLKPVEI